jgi:hypothetical protein
MRNLKITEKRNVIPISGIPMIMISSKEGIAVISFKGRYGIFCRVSD